MKRTETAARARQRASAWKVAAHAWRAYADGVGSWGDAVHAESNALAFELQGSKGETGPVVAGSYVRNPPKSVGATQKALSPDELERARRIDFLARWEADDAAPDGPNVIHMGAASVGVARRAICSDCYASGVTLRVPPAACPLCGSRSVLVGPPLREAERHGAKWPTRPHAIAARAPSASGQNLAPSSALPAAPRVEPTSAELAALVELRRGRLDTAESEQACRREGLVSPHKGPRSPAHYGRCATHGAPLNAAGHCETGLRLRAERAPSAAARGGAPASEPGRGAAPLGKIANSVSRANARTDGFQDGGPRMLPGHPSIEASLAPAYDCMGHSECTALQWAGVPIAICPGCVPLSDWLDALRLEVMGGAPS